MAATKDAILGPLHAGNNHIQNIALQPQHHPYAAAISVPSSAWTNFATPLGAPSAVANEWPTPYGGPQAKPSFNIWG